MENIPKVLCYNFAKALRQGILLVFAQIVSLTRYFFMFMSKSAEGYIECKKNLMTLHDLLKALKGPFQ